ncbi:TetR/AcrR family transcriptional regulator [Actinokineospora iranica]|uniref:DNA-binding transcriptional regulator, AcrR family n=1 Tax=Actinokineospora iranica TaxID=1271860 RepID=A0A1G6TIV6_9PSEU|nr:TetR/AcrR family transcriptional regulator [Actinokineospora iranica]SDD28990.1 DNA-binding transcriptional regulator, AcrR family [Actinokineospora iranica]
MKAECHTKSPERAVSPSRVDDDVLLDAARACVLDQGVRRTTLTDVARRAEVSRMTLYRRFPDVRSLLTALMTREFGQLLARVSGSVTGQNARARLVGGSVASVRAIVADPLMRTVLDRDGELVLPYVVQRLGSTQHIAEQFLLAQLAAGHEDGSVRMADPAAQARALLLVVQSFVLSHGPATVDVGAEALLAELAHVLDASLAP